MAYLVAQRGQRFLDRREARVRGPMARELQRQVGERRRHKARRALDAHARALARARSPARRGPARATASGSCRWTALTSVRQTSGLSAALLSSISTSSRAAIERDVRAPWTCATPRNDTGSCTRRAAPASIARCRRAAPAAAARLAPGPARPRRRGARIERRQVGAKALERQRRGKFTHRSAAAQSCSTSAARPTVAALALISARPSLAPSATGASPARVERCGARQLVAREFCFAFADQRQRKMRERRQIGDADRAEATARRGCTPRLSIATSARARRATRRSRRAPCPATRANIIARTDVASDGADRRPPRGRGPRVAGRRRDRRRESACRYWRRVRN